MNKMMTTSNKSDFEFEYEVSCVKTYTSTHTFTKADVEDWCEEREIGDTVFHWEDLNEEEQEAFFQTVEECYSHSDQCDSESREVSHEYCGEEGNDEDYEDGFPESVSDEWDNCWGEWLVARGWEKKIEERISSTVLTFANDDGVERKMTYKEYLDYEDYTGDDKMWLQYTGDAFVNIERCNQIWVKKPEAPIIITLPPFNWELLATSHGHTIDMLKSKIAELEKTLRKKDRMIKALSSIDDDSDEE